MKRTPLKRKSKSEKAKLETKLWEICKQVIRTRDGSVCVSCGKIGLEGSNWHTGHFIPKAVCGTYLKYDIRNLHSQCYHCNINLGGNGGAYFVALERNYGREFVDKLFDDEKTIIKADIHFYEEKIAEFTKLSRLTKDELQAYTRNRA